jgi:hypothetical protein
LLPEPDGTQALQWLQKVCPPGFEVLRLVAAPTSREKARPVSSQQIPHRDALLQLFAGEVRVGQYSLQASLLAA